MTSRDPERRTPAGQQHDRYYTICGLLEHASLRSQQQQYNNSNITIQWRSQSVTLKDIVYDQMYAIGISNGRFQMDKMCVER